MEVQAGKMGKNYPFGTSYLLISLPQFPYLYSGDNKVLILYNNMFLGIKGGDSHKVPIIVPLGTKY